MDKIKIVCRAFITDDRNRILFVKKTSSNFWSLPGGKLDPEDETLQTCLKRELKEELGLEIDVKEIRFVQELHKDDIRYIEPIWQAELKGNVSLENIYKTSGGELSDIQWIGQDELPDADVKPDFLREITL